MFPGLVSRLSERRQASAATIVADVDLILLTGATAITTITKLAAGGQIIFLIPTDGSIALNTGGNIAVAQTMIINKITVLIYSTITSSWYPHALA